MTTALQQQSSRVGINHTSTPRPRSSDETTLARILTRMEIELRVLVQRQFQTYATSRPAPKRP